MAKKPNKIARVLIPLGVMLIGAGVLVSVAVNQARLNQRPTPAQQPAQNQSAPKQAQAQNLDSGGQGAEPASPDAEPAEQTPVAAAPVMTGLTAERFDRDAFGAAELGAHDESSPELIKLVLSPLGAGIRSMELTRYYESIEHQRWVLLQEEMSFTTSNVDADEVVYAMVTPFAALNVLINGDLVSLVGSEESPVWRAVDAEQGALEARVVDADGNGVLRIVRTWSVDHNSFEVLLKQRLENLTDAPLDVQFWHLGPIDLPKDSVTYGGDKRRVSFGYLERPSVNANLQTVKGEAYATQARDTALGRRVLNEQGAKVYPVEAPIWPNNKSVKGQLKLVWAGMKSRYFSVTAHTLVDPTRALPDKEFHAVQSIDRIVPNVIEQNPFDVVIAMRFDTGRRRLAPGGHVDLDMGVYAGPLYKKIIEAQPAAHLAGVEHLVVFSFGGMCAFCTFQWLAEALIHLMRFLHDYVVFDWALAILVLVLIVRTILHPVTRWSQIRMQRFGKQMQAMAPKQKKIQEKYKGDQKKIQEEMAKLWREEGINPAGMLGCLPMFLQTPVWIALYASLYFAFDLRQSGAFFGVIQKVFPLNWPVLGHFLGDLSEPDRFIYFGKPVFTLPLMGEISAFNILPLILGVVFYVHQKYLTPQTSVAMSPEQESQQKIMKVMMVVMFPVIMYNAPSGLALYFICNSTLGIIESRLIRSHAEKKGLLDVEKMKKSGKPGFMGRMMALAEQQRKLKAQRDPRASQPGYRVPPPRRSKKR
jgi:YidC/Oxa1 family membrane protein insertase